MRKTDGHKCLKNVATRLEKLKEKKKPNDLFKQKEIDDETNEEERK